MKKLFKEQKVSLYQIQKDLNLDIKRLYRYADGTCSIKNMPSELVIELAVYFKMKPEKLYVEIQKYQKQLGDSNEN